MEEKVIAQLHPLERKILPYLDKHKSLADLVKASGMKEVEVMRSLQWLSNKKLLKINVEEKKIIELDKNGKELVKIGLPEKRFLKAIKEKELELKDIAKTANLDNDEVNVCLGMLRRKVAIEIKQGMVISITEQGKKTLEKESLEELFLKKLSENAVELDALSPEEKFAYELFRKRKEIVKTTLRKARTITLTEEGKRITKLKAIKQDFVEHLTPKMLKDGSWKGKQFRAYDVAINVPRITGGKRHFVKQAIEQIRSIMTEFGFKEMKGPLLQTSFWNFDALFTAQDHPVRELQDTFYIKNPKYGKLPDKKTVEKVKSAHENGGDTGSLGWRYKWSEKAAKKNVLRTHTTVLSGRTLASLKKEDLPGKFFAVGRCFRNETMDWSHLFEFNQFEGIVVGKDVNFRNHIGFLREFFKRLGFPKARFRPAYFPYTEMSMEIDVFHPVHKAWLELGGTGIFRPELVKPLLGVDYPVLAWGPGFDRIIMEYYNIQDLRELYKNDIKQIKEMKTWMRN